MLSGPAFAQELPSDEGAKRYIVHLAGDPLASYDGGVQGIPATTPKGGEKLNVSSSAAERYDSYLDAQHRSVRSSVGVSRDDVVADYTVALNGFAANLTATEAAQLRKSDQVLNVTEDEIYQLDTVSTPDYLGLTGDSGVWNQQFGGPADAGDGVIVGVLDSGVDSQNPSFAALDRPVDPDFTGVCDDGGDPEFACNTKVIGARYYDEEFGNTVVPEEYRSPRDADGHGSHTASTAAGNFGVPMSISGTDLGEGSGMAPAAQLSIYKVCWAPGTGYDGGCAGAGLIQAIDDATADGVDVINYSISGSRDFIVDPVEFGFLGAADAGVFVAASAGNSGDTVGSSSVAHNSPWETTVAASTHDRGANRAVILGSEETYEGVGVGEGVGPAPLVDGADVGLPGVDPQAAAECWLDADDDGSNGQQPTLDPAQVTGTIVICDRGTVARVDKSAAVDQAGGVGMILANTDPAQSLNADFHSVPTIHVDAAAGEAIHAYEADNADAEATIEAQLTDPVVAPEMAGFSSYGPAAAGDGDLLKPDITAPGVDVIAAYHEDPETGEPTFNSLSGTSMSSPHIAGLGALLIQKYPDWSPMAVKSAMQTTARQTNSAGEPIERTGSDATPLDYGSGEVVPAPSYNPGLVNDSGLADWFGYACAIDQLQLLGGGEEVCADLGESDASDFNSANIAIGELAGEQTVTRTVTDVTGAGGTYTAQVEAPAGMQVTVSPEVLAVPAGGEATFEVTITQADAPLNTYAFGSLTWVDGSTEVRSAIAVQPVALAAPDEIVDEGTYGDRDYEITPGFTGEISMDIDGLVASDVQDVVVPNDPSTTNDVIVRVDVPAGTKVVRFATYDEEVDAADIDMAVFNPSAEFVGASGSGGSSEQVTVEDPVAGLWYVTFDLFSAEATANVPLHTFTVDEADAGNMTVEPNPVDATSSQTETLTLEWGDLEPGSRYMGAVNYVAGGDEVGTTLVSIDAVPTVDRIAGADRFATAAEIAAEFPDGVYRVYIANGLA
nr:S8 family peptidase [Actinomycetota bacterium]